MTDYSKEFLIALREQVKLGPKTLQMLINHYGSIDQIISADVSELVTFPRISMEKAVAISNVEKNVQGIIDDLEIYASDGIHVLTVLDPDYPQSLVELGDLPLVLYYKGHFPLNITQFIAIVGTTNATAEGLELAVDYALTLSQKGAVIVSGLARGIDTAAHLGAVKAEGPSYAVLGCGLYNIYPPENVRLAEEMLEKGALISEYPPNAKVNTGRLISRNRIIVGLSQSVVVAEVDKESRGTIDAADRAKQQGKLLFAIGNQHCPIDPGLIEFGAIPLDNIAKADLIADHSF